MKRVVQPILSVGLCLLCFGCKPGGGGSAIGHDGGGLPDAPLSEYQHRLLDRAYGAVSKMPLDPHVRNRSIAQEKIVQACLELGQPALAANYAEGIANWRRATAFADIASHYARHGEPARAKVPLEKAERLFRAADEYRQGNIIATGENKEMVESLADWRIDRVKAHIAKAHYLLGGADAAAEWRQGTGDDETPKIDAMEAALCAPESFEEVMDGLAMMAETKHFEAVKGALLGFAELYERFYMDDDKRAKAEAALTEYRQGVPLFIQIEVLLEMADAAEAHGDQPKTLAWVDEADTLLESASYLPRMYFPPKARIVALRHRAGQEDRAAEQLRQLAGLYDDKRDSITDIHRAAVLCRVAEAAAATGDTEQALRCYAQAATEGQVNPNSRPQADDLNEICCSMALNAVEPTAALVAALDEMDNQLGTPW